MEGIKEIMMIDKIKDIKTDLKVDLIIIIEIEINLNQEVMIDSHKEASLEMTLVKKIYRDFLLVILVTLLMLTNLEVTLKV
jgi:hypothetical protein